MRQGFLKRDVLASLSRVIPGIVIGSAAGAVVGLATGRARLLYCLVAPHLHIWRALPSVALVPFLLLVLGVSEAGKITIIALGVFFPVWIGTHEGAGHVDHKYLEVAKDLSFTKVQVYTMVIFPATVPFIVAGMRTGIAIAYIMLFIGEWIGANKGIGYQLSVAHVITRTDHMVFGLLVLGLLAYCSDALYRAAVSRAFPWLDRGNA